MKKCILQGWQKRIPNCLLHSYLYERKNISVFMGKELQTLSLYKACDFVQMHDCVSKLWIVASTGGLASKVKQKQHK